MLSFLPKKNEIIFGLSADGNENTQFFILNVSSGDITPLTNNPEFKYDFGGWSNNGKYITYSSNQRNKKDFDIYLMDLETKKSEMIFSIGGSCYPLGFSPKDSKIAIIKSHSNFHQDLYIFNIEDKTSILISDPNEVAQYGSVKWLNDEGGFYYLNNFKKDFFGLSFYDFKTNNISEVLKLNWDIVGLLVSKDGKYLIIFLNEDGYPKTAIYKINPIQVIKKSNIPLGTISGCVWSNDGNFLVFAMSENSKSSDIWIWSKKDDEFMQITNSPSKIPEDVFVEPELIRYKSFDGLEIPAFLFLPKDLEYKNKKTPVIINIHGGPESQYTYGFAPITQYLVNHGYAVIAPNIRGSSGYGKKYMALDDVGLRMNSVKDLEYLHKYIENRNELNSDKIALYGGSYGGYMVLAGLVFYPELWSAGVDIVGISNLVTFLENTSPYRRSLREAEYGSLKDDKVFLNSISPFNFVENIKAPLLIIHGKNDPRVPLSEAEQVYKKLKDLNRKVDLLVYEDEGHGLGKLKNRLDAYPKIVDFLNLYLKS